MYTDKNTLDAIMTMRLRDSQHGFYRGIKMTQSLVSKINQEISQLISDPEIDVITSKKIIRLMLPSLHMLYEQFYPSEIEYTRKFLGQLRILRFDTSAEMHKLKEFELYIDQLLEPINKLNIKLEQGITISDEDLKLITSNMKNTIDAEQMLGDIRLAVDKRVTDVLHAISMFIDPQRANIIYEAFTKEP